MEPLKLSFTSNTVLTNRGATGGAFTPGGGVPGFPENRHMKVARLSSPRKDPWYS